MTLKIKERGRILWPTCFEKIMDVVSTSERVAAQSLQLLQELGSALEQLGMSLTTTHVDMKAHTMHK